MSDYNDIINLERPSSKKHVPMSKENRAAQFAPYAALTGYGEAINETGRKVSQKVEISEEVKELLSAKMIYIKENIKNQIEINVVYFAKDLKKSGGSYNNYRGIVKKIDEVNKILTFEDKTKINIDDVISITGEELNFFEII